MAQVVRIEGIEDLEEALNELKKATVRNVLLRTLMKTAQPIAEAGRMNAPRSANPKGPRLAESYTVSTKLNRAQKKASNKQSAVEVYVGPAPSVKSIQTEFGNAHQAPQPHLRPAWDENVQKVLDNIAKDLADEIEKARARAARKAERLAAKLKTS